MSISGMSDAACEKPPRPGVVCVSLYKKIIISAKAHKNGLPDQILVPEYLYSMIPQSVGDRAGYVLRNASKLDTDGSEINLHTKLSLSLRFELSSNLVETQLHLGLS